MSAEEVLRISLIAAPDGRPLARRVFFQNNSWDLDDALVPLVQAHAEYSKENSDRVAVIAGHTQGADRQRSCHSAHRLGRQPRPDCQHQQGFGEA